MKTKHQGTTSEINKQQFLGHLHLNLVFLITGGRMGVTRGELLALEEEKKQIEKELDDAFLVLTNNNVGMDDPLVDAEDYPRADISVYEVRHARTKIIRLRNDLNSLTERLSDALAIYHQAHPADSKAEAIVAPVKKRRLAKVDFIEEGSPAAVCGLLNGDFILEIGNVSENNFKGLEDIANAVKSSENSYMRVVVERGATTKRINLKPKIWGGPDKGLLGCKIMTATN